MMSRREFTFCPHCGTNLETVEIFRRKRPRCPDCGFVVFHDPKVAVVALVLHGSSVLLVRRAVEPERGKWALPGGYMDAGEMPDEALRREVYEEVGICVEVGPLLGIFAMGGPGHSRAGIVLAYRASPADTVVPELHCQDDVDAAGWFTLGHLPDDLAFESTIGLLRAWRAGEEVPPERTLE
jgi:ADP-ribose pyrophosphatase YjhB (NUDIX family)